MVRKVEIVSRLAKRQQLKTWIREGRRVFGAWTSLGHPSISEIFARSGVNFVVVDLEHTVIDYNLALQNIIACHSQNSLCLVRIASHNGEAIKRILDSGADGLIIPTVSSKMEVDQLVEWTKYPPLGKRGFGIARGQGYGFDFDEYTRTWNDSSPLIVQVENKESVENIAEIVDNPHVDGVMIGPYDLSGSLGIPGQLEHPLLIESIQQIIEVCKQQRIGCGTHYVEPDLGLLGKTFERGYTFAILSSDVFLLWKWAESAKEVVEKFGHSTTRHALKANKQT